jgi:hypothetical protein
MDDKSPPSKMTLPDGNAKDDAVVLSISMSVSPGSKSPPPRQLTWLQWTTFVACGMTISLPWAVVTSCGAFFEHHLTSPSRASSFMAHFASIFLGTKFGLMLVSMRMQRHIPPGHQLMIGSGGTLVSMLAFMLLAMLSPWLSELAFYALALTLTVVVAVMSAVLEAGAYHIAGTWHAINLVMLGQSLSGVLGSGMALASIAGQWVHSMNAAATAAFLGVALLAALTIVLLFLTRQLLSTNDNNGNTSISTTNKSTDGDKATASHYFTFRDFLRIARKCWPEVAAMFLGALSHLLIVPFVVSRTMSTGADTLFQRDLYRPTAFVVCALTDLAAKAIVLLLPPLRLLTLPVLGLTLGRCALLPLFFLGNVQRADGTPLINGAPLANDALYFVLLAFFCLAGSYLHVLTTLKALHRASVAERGTLSIGLAVVGMSGAIAGALLSALCAFLFF